MSVLIDQWTVQVIAVPEKTNVFRIEAGKPELAIGNTFLGWIKIIPDAGKPSWTYCSPFAEGEQRMVWLGPVESRTHAYTKVYAAWKKWKANNGRKDKDRVD